MSTEVRGTWHQFRAVLVNKCVCVISHASRLYLRLSPFSTSVFPIVHMNQNQNLMNPCLPVSFLWMRLVYLKRALAHVAFLDAFCKYKCSFAFFSVIVGLVHTQRQLPWTHGHHTSTGRCAGCNWKLKAAACPGQTHGQPEQQQLSQSTGSERCQQPCGSCCKCAGTVIIYHGKYAQDPVLLGSSRLDLL